MVGIGGLVPENSKKRNDYFQFNYKFSFEMQRFTYAHN